MRDVYQGDFRKSDSSNSAIGVTQMADGDFDPEIVRPSDWDPEIIPPVDPDTGLSTGIATAEGAVLGIPIAWVCVIVVGAIVFVLAIQGLSPLLIPVPPPPKVPHIVDAMQDPISEDALRALGEAANQGAATTSNVPSLIHDPSYPLQPGGNTMANTDLGWQEKLQEQRLTATPSEWPTIIKKHKEIYRKLGVDPCSSGFFPEACSQ
jgi:hypothetical protein